MTQTTINPDYRLTSRECRRCGATLAIERLDGGLATSSCFICGDQQDIPEACENYDPDLRRAR